MSIAEEKQQEEMDQMKKVDAGVKTMEDFTSPEELYQELIASVTKYENQENRTSSILFALPLSWQIWSWIKRLLWRGCCMMWWKTLS